MADLSSTQRTEPERDPTEAERAAYELAIHWVFPPSRAVVTPLFAAPQVIGRGADCAISLAGREVSRHHAELLRDGPLHLVRDLESRNGVAVNGKKRREAPLSAGDVLRVGECVGVLATYVADDEALRRELRALGIVAGAPLANAVGPLRRASAAGDMPVVIEGETGTGKELFGRAVHAWSGRRGPFVALSCPALPESMAEAELFGYRRGSFTGATHDHRGLFRAAQGGTLFLDDVVDLPLGLQAKLLRALQEQEIRPLGAVDTVRIDVRVVAASNIPLRKAVREERFRNDLYARLHGLTVTLPPLRERREDIAPIVFAELDKVTGGRAPAVEAQLIEALCLHDWPLNVRGLVQATRRLVAVSGDETLLRRSLLPDEVLCSPPERSPESAAGASDVRKDAGSSSEREAVRRSLERNGGNVRKTASELGLSRQKVYRLLDETKHTSLEQLRARGREWPTRKP